MTAETFWEDTAMLRFSPRTSGAIGCFIASTYSNGYLYGGAGGISRALMGIEFVENFHEIDKGGFVVFYLNIYTSHQNPISSSICEMETDVVHVTV